MKSKNLIPWLLFVVMAVLVFNILGRFTRSAQEISYGAFRDLVRKNGVESVLIQGDKLEGEAKKTLGADAPAEAHELAGKPFVTHWVGTGDELTRFLEEHGPRKENRGINVENYFTSGIY